MNPLFLSALHGLVAGYAVGPPAQRKSRAYINFGAPLVEEGLYRALPKALGLSPAVAGLAFAADHVRAEDAGVVRLGDVLLGAALYQQAFKAFGFWGAVGAHALHNVCSGVGQSLRGRKGR